MTKKKVSIQVLLVFYVDNLLCGCASRLLVLLINNPTTRRDKHLLLAK